MLKPPLPVPSESVLTDAPTFSVIVWVAVPLNQTFAISLAPGTAPPALRSYDELQCW